MLQIKHLKAAIQDKVILQGVDLTVQAGETHVIMGPNGSGKSTLANVIMGNPRFSVTDGEVVFENKVITKLAPEERSALGLFMAFQYPREIAGVQLDRFLYLAYTSLLKARDASAKPLSVFAFRQKLDTQMQQLNMNPVFAERSLNEGFSGGEKKKAEMLQLALLEPKLAILDETDSGLDVDALKIVGSAVNRFKTGERAVLIVTHYQRILEYVQPDHVHVMVNGRIVKSGGRELVGELEREGYQSLA